LPVVESDGRLVAIVDVLKLTYATLEQMNAIGSANAGDSEGGPMWGRFFESIGAPDDTESAISASHAADSHTPSRFLNNSRLGVMDSPHSEVHPNDSASMVDDDEEASQPPARTNAQSASLTGASKTLASSLPVDDGTYVFKFRTPSGRTHRFQARDDNIENLHDIVAGKLALDPFFTEWNLPEGGSSKPDPLDFQLQYTDTDGDIVVMSSDSDVQDAVKIARAANVERVVLNIHGGKNWNEAGASQSDIKAKEIAEVASKELKEVEKAESLIETAPPTHVHTNTPSMDAIFGIPRDLLLPASIGALAVVVIGVFTISRLTRD